MVAATAASLMPLLVNVTVNALVVSEFRETVAVVAAVPSLSSMDASAMTIVSAAVSSSVTSRLSVPSAKPFNVAVIVTVCVPAAIVSFTPSIVNEGILSEGHAAVVGAVIGTSSVSGLVRIFEGITCHRSGCGHGFAEGIRYRIQCRTAR